jgi:pimeloyl-ACP methyl ester carboxylesterase
MAGITLDPAAVRAALDGDKAFRLAARYWSAQVGVHVGDDRYVLHVRDGAIVEFGADSGTGEADDITVRGAQESWAKLLSPVPPPGFQDVLMGGGAGAFQLEGDLVGGIAPYYAAVQALVAVLRRLHSGGPPEQPIPDVERRFDTAVGRFVYIRVQGVQYRVYYEEAGSGIPMILQHTAGADGRQWRHVLEDPDYQQRFRMIAYDLPYHGKSVPPTGIKWWEDEYRLTKAFLIDTVIALVAALELDRPVYMGCSIGGHLAPDLAFARPDDFRAVVGINGGLATPPAKSDKSSSWFHPRVSNDWKIASMLGVMSPESPEAFRQETAWGYGQGAPAALKGDVHYYSREHDLTAEQARTIDTAKVGVYLLTGEYDVLAADNGTPELARNITGSFYEMIPGMGHFGPAEHPEAFKKALLPVFDDIVAKYT